MGPSGWVSGWILWPLVGQGTVTIHSFTFTLCIGVGLLGCRRRADAVPALLLESVGVVCALSV